MKALRRMTQSDLAQVLAWRNDERIRHWMLQPRLIAPEEHAAWFDRVSQCPTHVLLIYAEQGQDCGFMQVESVEPGGVGSWGFYASPDAPAGAGTRMGRTTLEVMFCNHGMHKIHAMALAHNVASQRMHQKLGFTQEGLLPSHQRLNVDGQDLICYGLTSEQWKHQP